MREIKFRVWKEEYEEMLYLPEGFLDSHKNPMQYTGLKDKNGKEIYEGDILETLEGHMVEMSWIPKGYWTWYEYPLDACKVIGNIYENEDLLNDNK